MLNVSAAVGAQCTGRSMDPLAAQYSHNSCPPDSRPSVSVIARTGHGRRRMTNTGEETSIDAHHIRSLSVMLGNTKPDPYRAYYKLLGGHLRADEAPISVERAVNTRQRINQVLGELLYEAPDLSDVVLRDAKSDEDVRATMAVTCKPPCAPKLVKEPQKDEPDLWKTKQNSFTCYKPEKAQARLMPHLIRKAKSDSTEKSSPLSSRVVAKKIQPKKGITQPNVRMPKQISKEPKGSRWR